MTGLAVYFFNIPGAMMRVFNCFTRRGLLIERVHCSPADNRHCALVLVDATPAAIVQIVRELESTVGVHQVECLDPQAVEQIAKLPSPAIPA